MEQSCAKDILRSEAYTIVSQPLIHLPYKGKIRVVVRPHKPGSRFVSHDLVRVECTINNYAST